MATYEDQREAEFLEKVFTGRSGQLENTVFALISPDCKTYLAAPGRSPHSDYSDSGDLADAMNWYADYYHVSESKASMKSIPFVKNHALALNIAACEGLPLVVVGGAEWTKKLQGFAGDQSFWGLAVFARGGENQQTTVEIPDEFGLKVQSQVKLDSSMGLEQLKILLRANQSGPKDMRSHVEEGHRRGIRWQTEVPVTDPQARY